MHYRTKCCESQPTIKLSKAEEPNPGRLVENYLNEIFDERKISDEQRAELWKFYFEHLDKGISEGYNPKVEFRDEELVNSLRQNIAEFCAFKENSFRNSATDLLIDENGNLRGKSEFLAEAAKINDEYNRRWLGTEYDQTVANANSAQQWQDFQRAKDLYPNLRYCTVGDDRVRAEHEALDGIVKSLDDPFWDAWMPPNDWGCRCWVEQTDDEPNGEVPGGVQMKIDFENNPGKTGEIFKNGGGAYLTSGGLNPEMIEKIGNWGMEMFQNIYGKVKETAKSILNESVLKKPREKQFKKIRTKSGEILQHLLYQKGKDHEAILETAKLFAKEGNSVEILPVLNSQKLNKYRETVYPDYALNKNPDLRINGIYHDVKEVEGFAEFTRNANRASKQSSIAVLKFDGDLDSKKMIQIKNRIFGENNRNHTTKKRYYDKDYFYILNRGRLYKYNRD